MTGNTQRERTGIQPPLCCHCNQPAEAKRLGNVLHINSFERSRAPNLPVWVCEPCEAKVGCHKMNPAMGFDTEWSPLGRPINRNGAAARIEAHKVIDPLWDVPNRRERRVLRNIIYVYLACELGIDGDFHVGNLTADGCRRAILAAHRLRHDAEQAGVPIGRYLREHILNSIT